MTTYNEDQKERSQWLIYPDKPPDPCPGDEDGVHHWRYVSQDEDGAREFRCRNCPAWIVV